MVKNLVLWVVIAVVLMSVFNNFGSRSTRTDSAVSYSHFLESVKAGQVQRVVIDDHSIVGKMHSGEKFKTYAPDDIHLVDDLLSNGVEVKAKPPEEPSMLMTLLVSFGPILLLIAVWVFFMRQMQGGGGAGGRGGPMGFGKSKARMLDQEQNKITFADVAGCDEAKQEVEEMVDFLRDPAKYQKLGGMVPRGALMVGPPGTGKTLLARAIAGEAKVPFFTISGSDFVEMFVGVGASRVRDLFEQGKKSAPCIIFIDEIDAVGRQRGAGLGGGHDEREQTLNALLVEMDGFDQNNGVIIIAATNRPDVLDPALLRPGRFDRQVVVDRPDVKGREGILKVHTRKTPLADDVNLKTLAKGTPGLSGAELANLVNEAALLAARKNKQKIELSDFEEAKDKIMMGMERKSMIISEEEKKVTAYHEIGHVLVALKTPAADPVHKVTIIPRGRALGVTTYLPVDEKHTYSKDYLEGMITYALGGRAAEKVVFNQFTTGAGNDIEKATNIARKMVCEWGMSEKLGPLAYGQKEEEIFLGREITKHSNYSELTAQAIDAEVKAIVDNAMQRAEQILIDNSDILHKLSKELLEREILDAEEISKIMRGEALPPLRKNNNGEKVTEKPAEDSEEIPEHVKELLEQRKSKNTEKKEEDSEKEEEGSDDNNS